MIQSKQFNGTKAYYRALPAATRSSSLSEQPACILELIPLMTHLQTAKQLLLPPFALSIGRLCTATIHSTSRYAVPLTFVQNKSTPKRLDPSALNSDPRFREVYLNTIGGLLTLILGQSPRGVRYSTFNTHASLISALMAFHGNRPGISQTRRRKTFAEVRPTSRAQP